MEKIQLYQGDCLEIMDKLIEQGVKVDAIITDPPYLINYCRHVKGHRFEKPIKNDKNEYYLIENYLNKCEKLLKDNGAIYVFGSMKTVEYFKQYIEKYFKLRNIIIWNKVSHGKGDTKTTFAPQYELLFYANKGRIELKGKRFSDIWEFKKVPSKTQIHQNQKPIDLLVRCIESVTSENDIVFDGFMGSGSTGIACLNTNRKFIGIELDGKYFEIAKNRIENYRKTLE